MGSMHIFTRRTGKRSKASVSPFTFETTKTIMKKIYPLCFSLLSAMPAMAQVSVKVTDNEVVIENAYLSRTFSTANHRLTPGRLVNKRANNTVFTPGPGSEEFALNPQSRNHNIISRKTWKAEADSWCVESATVGEPSLAIDGDNGSMWHTWYATPTPGGHEGNKSLPHSLIISLGKPTTFRAFGYLPRSGAYGAMSNGNIKDYEFYISNDKKKWTLVKKGTMKYNSVQTVWVSLGKAYQARYVKLTEKSSTNGGTFGACAEFYLTADVVKETAEMPTGLKASAMKLNNVRTEAMKDGQRVVFDLAPTAYTNPIDGVTSTWDIDMVVEMKNNDHFMRKYLLVKAADKATRTLPIDYIEMENLGTQQVSAAEKWTRQQAAGGEGGMSAYTITLGQPVYVDGLFFGSEFPQAENEIDEQGMYHTRYYSGKSLQTLDLNEHRLDADGRFRTWSNVIGATRSTTDHNVIRTDFFKYINTISRPIQARLQYNSWYDWMMTITEDRINSSFKEMERGFSQYGLRPLDSYVVDDGWNNYSQIGTPESGDTPNHSGFWEFNSKFPNGLKGASDIAHRYGSGFGIWLGPRGGYNFNQQWGKLLEANGNGTYSTTTYDEVTGDSVYVSKLRDFFIKQQRDYGVNYWKLDGFATQQPQASTNGRYITGGKNGNYYFTEHWERWYHTLADMYADADSRKQNLWINLTCYVNPSPWILQWSNSVWIQNSRDMWHEVVDGRDRELDQQLSYRDDRYYTFINKQQLQFPQAHIFNHDPVYGKTGGVAPEAMTDAEFRAYLYMMATRGTAFWEMLYSYNLMNEGNKWMINAEAMKFVERNYETLRNAIYFGQSPLQGGIYGYSCWRTQPESGNSEGFISFRNPSNKTQTYKLALNKAIGVPENSHNLKAALVMEYTGNKDQTVADVAPYAAISEGKPVDYGTTFEVTLKPGEIQILHFGAADKEAAQPLVAQSVKPQTVTITMNEPVLPEASNFTLTAKGKKVGKVTAVTTAEDYRTLTLSLSKPLKADKAYAVGIKGLKDWNGNATTATSPAFFYAPDSILLEHRQPLTLKEETFRLSNNRCFTGKGSFMLRLTLTTADENATIATQEGAFQASLTNGKICFKVGRVAYTTDLRVNDGKPHRLALCRENNGMVKVYVDGNLQGTAYDKKHICEPLPASAVVLGSTNSSMTLEQVELRCGALSYDKI